MKKKIILAAIGVVIVGSVTYNIVKNGEVEPSLFEVKRGNVAEEVSETGQVKLGEAINLNFKSSGIIQSIYVKVGNDVSAGSSLVKLNTAELTIQLQEAQANLEINQAKLNQLLAGSSVEEIRVAETALDNAWQTLQDTLDASYEKASGALTTVSSIQKTYFYSNDQESITVKDKKEKIESALAGAKQYLDSAKASPGNENIDGAFLELKSALEDIYAHLTVIRNTTEVANYRNVVSLADKTSLDTVKTNVSTGLANINAAWGDVKEAEDDLTLEKAAPRQADISLYQAQVNQTQARVDLLGNQIWESTLRSPVKGKVTAVNKELGELVQPSSAEAVVTILPANPYEIEVDIYEEDIVKMEIGDPVTIVLIALPDQTFSGQVITIDPAEALIEGVVYYRVGIGFNENPQGIKPGMTADIVIRTDFRENALIVPDDAISNKDGRFFVSVSKNNKAEEREITTGLAGSDDMVEVLSGLSEGEQIILD